MITPDGRIEFIKSELGLCFTFSVLTSIEYEAGDGNSAERLLDHAEEAYAAALPLVLEPKYSKHLPGETILDFTAELVRLRERLDELNRLRKQPAELPKQFTARVTRESERTEFDMEKEMKKSLELILEEISELGDREQIATLARAFWQARGCPEGTAEEDWYLAERELAERKAERRNLAPPLPRFPATSELSQAAEARNLQKSA